MQREIISKNKHERRKRRVHTEKWCKDLWKVSEKTEVSDASKTFYLSIKLEEEDEEENQRLLKRAGFDGEKTTRR